VLVPVLVPVLVLVLVLVPVLVQGPTTQVPPSLWP
jgi:hypothetical protein